MCIPPQQNSGPDLLRPRGRRRLTCRLHPEVSGSSATRRIAWGFRFPLNASSNALDRIPSEPCRLSPAECEAQFHRQRSHRSRRGDAVACPVLFFPPPLSGEVGRECKNPRLSQAEHVSACEAIQTGSHESRSCRSRSAVDRPCCLSGRSPISCPLRRYLETTWLTATPARHPA